MTGLCCTGGRPLRRLARDSSSLLPGAALLLLPKCPLCLTAWIAACTGIALPAVVASSVRPSMVIACILSASLLASRTLARFQHGPQHGCGADTANLAVLVSSATWHELASTATTGFILRIHARSLRIGYV